MLKNKFIILILSFYIFWIGVLPFILTKAVDVLCRNYSHNSEYLVDISKPKFYLSPLPILYFKAEEIKISAKNKSSEISFKNFKTNLRILPLFSGKIHFNEIMAENFNSSINLKERFVLDKDFFLKLETTPIEINSFQLKNYEAKFYRPDVKLPAIYKGNDFLYQRKNRFVSLKNKSIFRLGDKESNIDINLFLPKNNDIRKTVFDIKFTDFDIAPLKIYLKHYLPDTLQELKGYINIQANNNELITTFKNCALIMQDSAKSIVLPEVLTVKSKFNIKRQYIDFSNIDIVSKNINISMNGRLQDYFGKTMPSLDFNIYVNKSRIEDIINILPAFEVEEIDVYSLKKYKFYGNVLANINIKGRLPEPDVNGSVYVDDGVLIKPIPNTTSGATIKLLLKGRSVDFDVKVPAGGLERVTVNGSQELYNIKYSKMFIKSSNSVNLKSAYDVVNPLHEILNFIVGPLPIMNVEGEGNIDITVKGNRKNPHIWGVLNLKKSKASFKDIAGFVLENADAKLVFSDQNVTFTSQLGKVNGNDFAINGICDLFGKFNFHVLTKGQPSRTLYDSIMTSSLISEYKQMLPKLENIQGLSDWDLNVYGAVKSLDELAFNKNVFIKGDILLQDNSFDFEGVNISKTNGKMSFDSNVANIDLSALAGVSPMKLLAKVKNNIADVSLQIPRLNPNKIWKTQITGKYLLPYVSVDLVYKGKIDNIEYDKVRLVSEILESNQKSALNFASGNLEVLDNKINVKNLRGTLDGAQNPFAIDLKLTDAFSSKPIANGNFNLSVTDLKLLNDLFNSPVLPENVRKILRRYEFKEGSTKLDAKINNSVINAYTDLSGISLTYLPNEMPINIINGALQAKNNNLKLNKINMLADNMPILIDGEIRDILGKQNFNLYINTKPQQEFIDKYINKNVVYPIKIKGDIVSWFKLKGTIDDYELKSNLNISKDSSIYHFGATVGDIENSILLALDSHILNGKNVKVKDFSYDKLIDSQNGRQTQLSILKAWGGIDILKDDLNFRDFRIKTQKPTDARIFNVIFKKPNIKQGQFTSDLKINGKLSNPRVIGDFHIFETDIPFFDTVMKNIALEFKDKVVEIDSRGEVMGNEVSFQGVLKNKLSQPYHLEKGLLYTKDLDLNRIAEKLKVSQVDDVSTFESFDDFRLSALSFKNFKFKADNIRLRNLQATNYEAITSLNEKGIFEVNKFLFNIAQGSLSGNYKYNLKTNDMHIGLDAKSISADDLAVALFDLKNQIYGDLTGQTELACNGTNFEHCMETLNGKVKFNVKDGKMPKLGSLEYLLKASNLVKGGFTGLSINSVIELISPLKTGDFSDISGDVNIENGLANDVEIITQGKDLSLFVEGTYNFSTSQADMEVFGLLSRKMSTFFGPIGNLSINTLFNVIPGVDLSKDSAILNKINKIPGIELSSKDFRKFIAEIRGNINGEDYVTSFKWIN